MLDFDAFTTWLQEILLYIPQKVYEWISAVIVDAINALFLACSVCDFSNLDGNLAALPLSVLFILSWFKVGTGLTTIAAAYFVRFLIRRLPVVG